MTITEYIKYLKTLDLESSLEITYSTKISSLKTYIKELENLKEMNPDLKICFLTHHVESIISKQKFLNKISVEIINNNL